jgi:predicted dithiol-disulfide oxidoreductase (DUF899 family)
MIRKMDAAPMTYSIRVAPLKTYMMPNASDEYRAARENLIDAELALREHVQRVAALRRTLPAGPTIPDYEFVEGDERVRLSDLFSDGRPYLLMYHVMYWQDDQEFCPMCSMWVDGLDGVAHHISQRANIVAATIAPADKARAWAKHRGWRRIRFLADADPSFQRDSGAEIEQDNPQSTVLVFEKTAGGIRHVYTAHAEFPNGLNNGVDMICATWHMFDLLPSGRGDWNAKNEYVT